MIDLMTAPRNFAPKHFVPNYDQIRGLGHRCVRHDVRRADAGVHANFHGPDSAIRRCPMIQPPNPHQQCVCSQIQSR